MLAQGISWLNRPFQLPRTRSILSASDNLEAMGLMYSQMIPLGTRCPSFSLPNIDGRTYTLDSFADKPVLVVIIQCNHCPYVQAQWPRFVALDKAYRTRGVQLIGINPNDAASYPEDSFEKMKEYACRFGMEFPYLRDEAQQFSRKIGAVCTPDTFVFDANRELTYRGRLDDNWEDSSKAQQHDLANAIDALIAGNAPAADQKPSQGCSIKWKLL